MNNFIINKCGKHSPHCIAPKAVLSTAELNKASKSGRQSDQLSELVSYTFRLIQQHVTL